MRKYIVKDDPKTGKRRVFRVEVKRPGEDGLAMHLRRFPVRVRLRIAHSLAWASGVRCETRAAIERNRMTSIIVFFLLVFGLPVGAFVLQAFK